MSKSVHTVWVSRLSHSINRGRVTPSTTIGIKE